MPIAVPTMNGEFVSSSVSHPSTTTSPIIPVEFRKIDAPRQRKFPRRNRLSWKMAGESYSGRDLV